MQRELRHHLGMFLIAGLIFFVNLGGPKLWDRDEPRNAGCAVEMIERGDWIVPVFNTELRIHKPVLLYWFTMTAYAVFGVNEFAARFWSAVLGLGTVLATYHIGRRLFAARAGFWAAVILSSCMMFPVAARAATPDSVLIFFTTLALLVYVYGAFPPRHSSEPSSTISATDSLGRYFPSSWPTVALMYGLMGVAMLAKGPVGLVLPTAVIGMFLLIARLPTDSPPSPASEDVVVRWLRRLLRPFAPRHFLAVCWSMRPITALAVSLTVALPWYVWVGVRTDGEWPRGFFLVHHLQRAMEPMEGHDGPFFYYLLAIAASFFPWSLLLIPSVEHTAEEIRRRPSSRAAYVFVACWAAVYIAAFSLARTKLPSYVTPSLPALALLTACCVVAWSRRGRTAPQFWFRFAFHALVVIGVAIGVVTAVASCWLFPGDGWLGAVGLILVVGGLAGDRYLRRFQPRKASIAFAGAAVAFACVLFAFVSVRLGQRQQCDELFQAVYEKSSQPTLAAYGSFEPSWVFYAGRTIRFFPNDDPDAAIRFLDASSDHFLITTDRFSNEIEPFLSERATILACVPYFLRQEKLLAIGCLAKNAGEENQSRVANPLPLPTSR